MASNDGEEENFTKYSHICAICLETFQDPRQLPCCHSFCSSCLKGYLEKILATVTADKSFPCPLCRRRIDITARDLSQIENIVEQFGVLSLSKLEPETESTVVQEDSTVSLCESCARDTISNKAVKFCNECYENICEECANFHKRNKLLSTHTFRNLEREVTPTRTQWRGACCQHTSKNCEYVCMTHSNVYCSACIIMDHRSCEVLTIESYQTCPQHLEKIEFLQKSLRKLDEGLRHNINKELEYIGFLEQRGKQFEVEYKAHEEAIVQEENQTLNSLKSRFRLAIEATKLEARNRQLDTHSGTNELDECRHKLEEIHNGQLNPVIATKQLCEIVTKKQHDMERHTDKHSPHTIQWIKDAKPLHDALAKSFNFSIFCDDVRFTESITLTYRNRLPYKTKLPSSCLRDSAFLCDSHIICTDETRKVLRLFHVKTMKQLGSIPFDIQPFGIANISDNLFAVTFPNEKYIRILNIKVEEITLEVTSTLVSTIETEHGMHGIRRYKIHHSNAGIITACKTTDCFYFYNTSGLLLNTVHIQLPVWRAQVRGWHILAYAQYFTVDDIAKRIYIACSKWNSVLCFKYDGEFVFMHDRPKSTLQTPVGIACGPQGDVFVCCYGNGRIQRLGQNGNFKHSYDLKSLRAPTFLVFNSENSKCVVCSYNNGIEVNVFRIEISCPFM